jgi:hypothetical protein
MKIIKSFVIIEAVLILFIYVIYQFTSLPQPKSVIQFGNLVIAHRGDALNHPENSLQAIRSAKKLGAHAVEIDVLLSKDLVPVVIHDDTLDRTTLETGKVSDYTAKELSQIKLLNERDQTLSTSTIPSLEAAIQLSISLGLILEIELKTEAFNRFILATKISELFEKYDLYDTAFISSFDPRLLYYVGSQNHEIVRSLALKTNPPYPRLVEYVFHQPAFAKYLGVSIIEPDTGLASDDFLSYWVGKGFLLNVWVVNSQRLKDWLLSEQVSITTDCPVGSC